LQAQAVPKRRLCFLIAAVAVLLAVQSQDERKTSKFRTKCAKALEMLTPQRIVNLGLNADFASELLRFVRTFEVSDHDPAVFAEQFEEFRLRLIYLYNFAFISEAGHL
jgi:hypothetical protein